MKPRRVTVTLELTTSLSIKDLRRAAWWNEMVESDDLRVLQAQADVIRDDD